MTKRLCALILAAAGAAHATTWQNGDLTTYHQGNWGGVPGTEAGATLLVANFNTVYAPLGGVIVGSASGFTMVFTDANSVLTYLPSIGPQAPLSGSVVDPISTASGEFGGAVLALEFNVDFSDAGLLPGTSGLRFGDLILENFSTEPAFNGLTVRQFLADLNILLSGGSTIFSISDLGFTVDDVSASFYAGTPNTFAQDHLVAPASANPTPEPSSWTLLSVVLIAPALNGLRRQTR